MRSLHRFNRWENWLGIFLVLFFVVGALAAPWLSPMDPKYPGEFQQVGTSLDSTPHPPSSYALLGTLPSQYDVFHTLIWGARDALVFGLTVALASGVFGIVFGAIAGYVGGAINSFMMRFADAFLAFPIIAGVVFLRQLAATAIQAAGGQYIFNTQISGGAFVYVVGPPSLIQNLVGTVNPLMITLILFTWMPYARLINSTVISLKNFEFILAARALGANPLRIIFRHLIPNSIAPAIVLMARDVGGVVLLQATLTFIHVGGDSYWGDMLSLGRDWVIGPGGTILTYWWTFVPATLALILFGIGWNLLGDALNDLLDPYAR